MIYHKGLPRPTGATDFMDSAHAAGMLILANSSEPFSKLHILAYILSNGLAVRNPDEEPSNNPLNFTRDQLIPLAAGLCLTGNKDKVLILYNAAVARGYRAQNTEADYPGTIKKFPNGADILTPSVMNHLRICAGLKPKLLGKAWLILDMTFNGLFTPMAEPNNLIAMALMAGPFYKKLLKVTNPKLNEAIMKYWGGWRGELELASQLIEKLK